MKKLFYFLYAFFFNLCRILPLKKNRVAFVAPHNGGNKDSLGILRSYVEEKGGYEIITISTRDLKLNTSGVKSLVLSCLKAAGFFTVKAKALATSKYVFLNDNFMPMASLNFSKDAVITQLWHAEGAFKKFGLSAPLDSDVGEREKKGASKLTYVICSSENVKPVYAEAFGVDESKVLPLGAPRIDSLLSQKDTDAIRNEFDSRYPQCKGKKLVLYAPTFRDDPKTDKNIVSNIDAEAFSRILGDEYSLLIKLHPQIHSAPPVEGTVDVTSGDINSLTLISDVLVTDYSSVCMDFALLSKPCIFFAFDLENYEKERSFYYDYESYVPGEIVRDFGGVISAIKKCTDCSEKLAKFRDFNFDYVDCSNTKRVFDRIFGAEKN